MKKFKQEVTKRYNQIQLLKQIAEDSYYQKNNSKIISQRIQNIVYIMQKRQSFIYSVNPQNQFHDYVIEFYQNKISQCYRQLNNIQTQNESLRANLLNYQKTLSNSQNNNHFESTKNISELVNKYQLQKELKHAKHIIQENQQFENQQNQIIKELRVYINKIETDLKQYQQNYQTKIYQLDKQLNLNQEYFKKFICELQSEKNILYREIKELEISNIKYIQEAHAHDEELSSKDQQIKSLSRKIYDLSISLIGKQKNTYNSQNQFKNSREMINLLQFEITSWKDKYQYLNNLWESKLKKQNQKVYQLENLLQQTTKKQKIEKQQIQNLNKQNIILKNIINQKQEQIQYTQNQLNQLTKRYYNLQNSYIDLQRNINNFNISNQYQKQQLDDAYTSIKEYQQKFYSIGQILTLRQYQNQQQKNIIKKDIIQEIENLLKVNNILEDKIQKLSNELVESQNKIQEYQKTFQLEKNNQKIIKNLQIDKNKLLTKLQETQINQQLLLKKIQKISNINNALTKQLEIISKEIQFNYQFGSSSSSYEQNEETKKLIQTNQQKQIKNSIQENKTMVKKLNENSQLQIKDLKQQINKKNFEIKQLQSKINILQIQLRQMDTINSNQKIQMSLKIKQLEGLLSQRFNYSSRVLS